VQYGAISAATGIGRIKSENFMTQRKAGVSASRPTSSKRAIFAPEACHVGWLSAGLPEKPYYESII
jgi:hypothetical protein